MLICWYLLQSITNKLTIPDEWTGSWWHPLNFNTAHFSVTKTCKNPAKFDDILWPWFPIGIPQNQVKPCRAKHPHMCDPPKCWSTWRMVHYNMPTMRNGIALVFHLYVWNVCITTPRKQSEGNKKEQPPRLQHKAHTQTLELLSERAFMN